MSNAIDQLSELIYDQDERAFFDAIAHIDFPIDAYDSSEHTLLHVAAKVENSKNIIAKLVELGIDFDIADRDGNTPLHHAVNYGCLINVEFLLELGADLSIKNNKSNSPLHVACSNNNLECVRILISHKADVNLPGGNDKTPIIKAVEAEADIELIELLLQNGANINSGDGVATPLMVAISYGNLVLVKYLIGKGAEIEGYRNRNGEDALAFARRLDNQDIIDALVMSIRQD